MVGIVGSAGDVRCLVDELCSADVAVLELADTREAVAKLSRVEGWLHATRLALTRRMNDFQMAGEGGDPTRILTGEGGQSNHDAASAAEQAELCGEHTELEDSLARGELSPGHLAVIAKYRSRLTHAERSDFELRLDDLRDVARTLSVDGFDRHVRRVVAAIKANHRIDSDVAELEQQRKDSLVKRWVDQLTGLHHTTLIMDPIRDAKFHSALAAELAALRKREPHSTQPWGSLQIDAVIAAMSGGEAAQRSSEVIVIIDHDTLIDARHDRTVCETIDGAPVPVSYVRWLCEEAIITIVGMNDSGGIHNAMQARTANREQRRALAGLYRTCAFPGCDCPFTRTRAHHVRFSAHHGPTALGNLLPVCDRHHHFIHDLGWHLTLDPKSRTATWAPPNGGPATTTTPDRAPPAPDDSG